MEVVEQGRLNNRFAQKETKPIFKGINIMNGRLVIHLLDANVVITTNAEEKSIFFPSDSLNSTAANR